MGEGEFRNKVYSFMMACSEINDAEDFDILIRVNLRQVLPHDMTAYGVLQDDHRSLLMVNIDYPDDFIKHVVSTPEFLKTVVRNQMERREPEFYPSFEASACTSQWSSAARDNHIHNIAWYGAFDLASRFTTYFVFSQLRDNSAAEIKRRLCMIVPYLHSTLSNILAISKIIYAAEADTLSPESGISETISPSIGNNRQLSIREEEVLMWMYYGKKNSEIASILSTSVFTIKNHVQNILIKLGANNRTHAVMQATREGLLRVKTPELWEKPLLDTSRELTSLYKGKKASTRRLKPGSGHTAKI
jgi:DNA-binding CsgD family transcriptional regulator